MKKFRGSFFSNLTVLNLIAGLGISLLVLSSNAAPPPAEQSKCLIKPNQEARNIQTNKVLGQDTNEGGYGICYLEGNDYIVKFSGGRRIKVSRSAVAEAIPLNELQTSTPSVVERLTNRFLGSKKEAPVQKVATAPAKAPESITGTAKIFRISRPKSPEEAAATATVPSAPALVGSAATENAKEASNAQQVNVLASLGKVAVKTDPNLTSSFECPEGISKQVCEKAKFVDHQTPLTLTGNEAEDRDNNIKYVEATYTKANYKFVGWFDKKQTTLDPKHAQVRAETAVYEDSNGSWNNFGEVRGSSESYTLNQTLIIENRAKRLRQLQGETTTEATVSSRNVTSDQSKLAQEIFPNSKAKGRKHLIRLHNNGKGLCGSTNYTESGSTKSYANPLTACLVSKLAETWQKEYCPNNGACRLEFGNISHETNALFGPHRSHTNGYCMDVRPIKKSGSGSLTYKSNEYDKAKTRELLTLIKKLGGDSILFNDPALIREGLSGYYKGHADHVHFCFKPSSSTANKQCENYQPDEKICPSSDILFNHPTMQAMIKKL